MPPATDPTRLRLAALSGTIRRISPTPGRMALLAELKRRHVLRVAALYAAPEFPSALTRPLVLAQAPAGFPSPADDHLDRDLDLHVLLIQHPAATYFVRLAGDSMQGAGLYDGDLLIVDRSLGARIVVLLAAAPLFSSAYAWASAIQQGETPPLRTWVVPVAVGVVTFLRGAGRTPFERTDSLYAEDVAVRIAAALDLETTAGPAG